MSTESRGNLGWGVLASQEAILEWTGRSPEESWKPGPLERSVLRCLGVDSLRSFKLTHGGTARFLHPLSRLCDVPRHPGNNGT